MKRYLLIGALIGAILACTGEQRLGSISPGANDVTFTIRGEVNHSWDLAVTAGTEYEVIITNQSLIHPLDYLAVSVTAGEWKNIASPLNVDGNTASVTFTAPHSGSVR